MKKRIIALSLVLVICLTLCSVAVARGPLRCKAGVQSGNSYAKLEANFSENLYVSFNLYKTVGSSEVFQCSASNNAYGTSVTARSTKTLTSGSYVMYIYGYGDNMTVNETRYFVI